MNRKYGIGRNTIGVYMIENKINHKKYVGSSIDVASRFSEHLGREVRLHPDREFYKDIIKYGRGNFICALLEECEKDKLLKREQYWYDKLQPEYNIFRPVEYTAYAEGFKEYQKFNKAGEKTGKKLKEKYSEESYKNLFHEIQSFKFRPVIIFNDSGFEKEFDSIRDCARWLDNNTEFKGKNKASKVKAVCDGERPTAYGYKFRYVNEKCNDYPIGSREIIDTSLEAESKQ